jgi:hypothetical protein
LVRFTRDWLTDPARDRELADRVLAQAIPEMPLITAYLAGETG